MQKKIVRRILKNSGLDASHLHPILQRIYEFRGIQSSKELERDLEQLLPYHNLMGIDQAAVLLAKTIEQQKKILIIGDFDADGATSTAVAVRALKSFGAAQVEFLVPNRFAFGYGLTPELVEAARKFHPELIITVDNGMTSYAGVAAAKKLGIEVIITDHHLSGGILPPADVIVNPNQPQDTFASKHMAGVGVIFYVMLALRRYLSDHQWFQNQQLAEPKMANLLDLVALGTVADVVALDQNNRILVHQGLRRIRAGRCVPGITALLEVSNKNQTRVTASDIGFSLAPRLNAAGRLEDMSLGIECLLCDDLPRAREMAERLHLLNEERRVIEQDMQEQALHILKKIQPTLQPLPRGICLFEKDWHQGVIGIVASRMKDKFQRPVIVFALANENELKGSARSIPSVHIRDILADIAASHPHLIGKFGGHAMAAGLTLPRAAFADFSKIFDERVAKKMGEEDLNPILLSDGELQLEELTLEIAEALREAGPWGQAFPEPLFDGAFKVLHQRIVGGKHLKLMLGKENKIWEAIAFNVDLNEWPNYRCEAVNIAYRMDVNEFQGKRNVQLIVEHLELA